MGPPGAKTGCEFEKNFDKNRLNYANCHRFDQAAINLILGEVFGFSDKRKFNLGADGYYKKFFQIVRTGRKWNLW